MEINSKIKTRIIKEDFTEKNINNLMSNIGVTLQKFYKSPKTFELSEIIIEDVGKIIDETIYHHICCGDISKKFEKDFRKFLASVINIDIS